MSYNESLNSNSNYPVMSQSEWENAPWNREDTPPKEVEVTVSITMSKTFKIDVDDYTTIEDDDGSYISDFSECNLYKALEDQVYLPNEIGDIIEEDIKCNNISISKYKGIIEDLKGWNVDDSEVILE